MQFKLKMIKIISQALYYGQCLTCVVSQLPHNYQYWEDHLYKRPKLVIIHCLSSKNFLKRHILHISENFFMQRAQAYLAQIIRNCTCTLLYLARKAERICQIFLFKQFRIIYEKLRKLPSKKFFKINCFSYLFLYNKPQ